MNKRITIVTSFLLMWIIGNLNAGVIGLKTRKPVGEKLEMAFNADLQARFEWSNGETEELFFDGSVKQIEIKSDSLTITSLKGDITRFYVPENGLVSLNTTEAPGLVKLFCSDNDLSELNLSKNKQLRELDCQGNVLTTLLLTGCPNLEQINCACNELENLSYNGNAVRSLVCADNKLDTLRAQYAFRELQVLWCSNNKLGSINLSNSKSIRAVCAASNNLSDLTLPTVSQLTDVWLEHNKLTRLDLSKATALETVIVNDNQLAQIDWSNKCAGTLKHLCLENNELFFNSFPTLNDNLTATLVPQRPFHLTDDIAVNEEQNWSDYLFRNAFSALLSLNFTVTDIDGKTLEKGEDKDYNNSTSSRSWVFYKLQKGVNIAATSSRYPGIELSVQPFGVTDYDGIDEVIDSGDLIISATNGVLNIVVRKEMTVKVYDAMGRCAINEEMPSGNHSWPLASGIYMVNGYKILVP